MEDICAPETAGATVPGYLGRVATTVSIMTIMTIVALAGCQRRDDGMQAPATGQPTSMFSEKSFSSGITGYNHTDQTIGSFDVNGVWGGNSRPHSGGGSSTCCVELPLPWHAGLTVKISWEDEKGQQHERVVAVPRYDPKSLGIFNVHFLRGGEIKVFDLNGILGSPDYPLQGEEANLKPGVPNFQYPRERLASDGAAGKSAKESR